jgi:hypothetical protein
MHSGELTSRTAGHRASLNPVTMNLTTDVVHSMGIKITIIRTLNVVRLVTNFDVQGVCHSVRMQTIRVESLKRRTY